MRLLILRVRTCTHIIAVTYLHICFLSYQKVWMVAKITLGLRAGVCFLLRNVWHHQTHILNYSATGNKVWLAEKGLPSLGFSLSY